MQSLAAALPAQDAPITGVTVVADMSRCPSGYVVIDRTYDSKEDADLWKDSFFSKKITRYICISRNTYDTQGRPLDVLEDIAVVNGSADLADSSWTLLDNTVDTHEKAMKKRNLAVKFSSRSTTTTAISDLIVLNRQKRPPSGFCQVGELNSMLLCYKTAPLAVLRQPSATTTPSVPSRPPPPVPAPPQLTRMSTIRDPLAGVPFELNRRYTNNASSQSFLATVDFKSATQIENEFQYKFSTERSVLQANNL